MLTVLASVLVLGGAYATALEPRQSPTDPTSTKPSYAVVMTNSGDDTEYTLEMDIGTPPSRLPIILDAWAPYMRVWNGGNKTPRFKSNESATFHEDEPFGFDFRLYGNSWATDVVTLGNQTNDNMRFVWAGDNISDSVSWGFGWASEQVPVQSYWHNASAQWADPMVGLFLSRHRHQTLVNMSAPIGSYRDSELWIGGYNKRKIAGNVTFNSFDSKRRWNVPVAGISVNGHSIDVNGTGATPFVGPTTTTTTTTNSSHTNNSAADNNNSSSNSTAQSWVSASVYLGYGGFQTYVPPEVAERIFALIPGAHAYIPEGQTATLPNGTVQRIWMYPCNTTGIDFRIQIGDVEYPLQWADMAYMPSLISNNNNNNSIGGGGGSEMECMAALQENRAGGWTLGTSILKSMYTVFDFATPAIGFAQLADDAQPDVKPDPYPSPSTSGAWRVHISVVLVAAAVAAVNLL